MKICSKCKKNKDTTEFHNSKSSKDGYTYYCKQCNNGYKFSKSKENKKLLIEYLNNDIKCIKCGIKSKHGLTFFDWHHIVPEDKGGSVPDLMKRVSFDRVLEEVKKCLLLCPNCHANIHIEELGGRGIHNG